MPACFFTLHIFAEKRGKVFITYDTGRTKADSDEIVRAVSNLKKNASNNQFEVTLDSWGPAPSPEATRAIFRNFVQVRRLSYLFKSQSTLSRRSVIFFKLRVGLHSS